MGEMRNNDRIEGPWRVLGRGIGTDPEKLQDLQETKEIYDMMADLELLRKGKIKSVDWTKPQNRKPVQRPPSKFPFPQNNTFERAD